MVLKSKQIQFDTKTTKMGVTIKKLFNPRRVLKILWCDFSMCFSSTTNLSVFTQIY